MQTQEKGLYCFYKIFLKINSTNKGKFCLLTSDSKRFLYTSSRQSSFLLTNQNAHLITHKPIKFRVTKVKICGKSPASKRKRYQLWILLNLWEKCLKFFENRRNIQKIYDSVRKEDEKWKMKSLCLIALESSANLPDLSARENGWEVESLIAPWEILLVWNHSSSRQGWIYAVKSKGIKSIILVSWLLHSSKF